MAMVVDLPAIFGQGISGMTHQKMEKMFDGF
jgi:hypothetical protein